MKETIEKFNLLKCFTFDNTSNTIFFKYKTNFLNTNLYKKQFEKEKR